MVVDVSLSGTLPVAYVSETPQVGEAAALLAARGDIQALVPNASTETPAGLPVWLIVGLLLLFLFIIMR